MSELDVSTLATILASFSGMFYRGTKVNYVPGTTHKDKLYFATDTHELLVNGVSYGGGGIANVTLEGDTLKFEMTDGAEKTVSVADLLKYKSAMSDSLATVEDFGGIPAGTTVAQLKAKTISQVLDDLIFPTVQPTIGSQPSASLVLKSGFSDKGVYEVGAAAPQDPANFTKGYSRGAINIAGVKKQDYAGDKTAEVLYYGSSEANTELPAEIPEGETVYNYKVTFAAGPQPLDSKGGNATSISKYSGGSATGKATINGVYPYYGSTGAGNALVKLALTTASQVTFTAPLETAGGRHGFKLPAKYNVTKVRWYNTLGGNWVEIPVTNFTTTTANETVQGKQVSYKTYRRNEAALSGETQFEVTFTKNI